MKNKSYKLTYNTEKKTHTHRQSFFPWLKFFRNEKNKKNNTVAQTVAAVAVRPTENTEVNCLL